MKFFNWKMPYLALASLFIITEVYSFSGCLLEVSPEFAYFSYHSRDMMLTYISESNK
jgi:hypothetical protein